VQNCTGAPPGASPRVASVRKRGKNNFSPQVCGKKNPIFSAKPTWKLAYNYNPSHSQLFIQNEAVQGMQALGASREESLSSTLVSRACFISFVICL